jgi:ABC-type dipeptide/oligopeptide/nickel transport system permease subunit
LLWLTLVALGSVWAWTLPPVPHALEHSLKPGHDVFGRPLLILTAAAAAQSLLFALASVTIAAVLGTSAGVGLAFLPERLRALGMRALDFVLAFPSLLVSLAWTAVRGPGWETLLVALCLGSVPPLIRFAYARTREIAREDYVIAAHSLGASRLHIARIHGLPATVELLRAKLPSLLASALIAESTLTFLGVGAPLGEDTWGSLLAQARDLIFEAPHIAWISGVPLIVTIWALQTLTDRVPFKALAQPKTLP